MKKEIELLIYKHDWKYDAPDFRKCERCLKEEVWDEDTLSWIWVSSEDFMDSIVVCVSKKLEEMVNE